MLSRDSSFSVRSAGRKPGLRRALLLLLLLSVVGAAAAMPVAWRAPTVTPWRAHPHTLYSMEFVTPPLRGAPLLSAPVNPRVRYL